MKRILSVLICLMLMLSCCVFCFAADSTVSLGFLSDAAGHSSLERDALVVIRSDNIEFADGTPTDAFSVYDYAGNTYSGTLKAGRTYYIYSYFRPVNGYTFPDGISESDLDITCNGDCEVLWAHLATGNDGNDNSVDYLEVSSKLTVKGNFIQRLFGAIADFFLKLSAWSPY